MLNAGFQYLEQRDANDTITKDGVVGKNSPFATSDNSGIYDVIAEDLRWLKENVDDVKDTSDLEAIKQSVTDMYNDMKNNSAFGETAAKAQAEEAKKQAQAALEPATNAKTYHDEVMAKSTEINDTVAEIKAYIEKAQALIESNKELEQSIADYATVATNKANEASISATKAATSETNAKTSETNASTSKSNAATSESNAKYYMATAKEYMQKAQEALAAAQAIQSIVDTAKANAEKCLADVEAVKNSLAKMITYQGSVDNYSDLPTNPQVGYSYNVKNADKTHGVNAGDNLVWNGEDWDNLGGAVDMSLFAELGKDVKFNTVTATRFKGDLNGTADSATKATNDSNGANIANTYVKKAGGTTTGKITFASTDLNNLPEVNKTSDDNMSGVRFSSKTKFLGAVGKRLSNGEDLLNLRSDNTTTDVVLDSRNYTNYAPTKTGVGASGTWGININGNAAGLSGDLAFPNIGDVATSRKISWGGSTDGADIYYQTTASDQGNLVLNLRDDANCYLRIAANGAFKSYFSPDGVFHGTATNADTASSVAWSNVADKPAGIVKVANWDGSTLSLTTTT